MQRKASMHHRYILPFYAKTVWKHGCIGCMKMILIWNYLNTTLNSLMFQQGFKEPLSDPLIRKRCGSPILRFNPHQPLFMPALQ